MILVFIHDIFIVDTIPSLQLAVLCRLLSNIYAGDLPKDRSMGLEFSTVFTAFPQAL